MDRIFTVNQQPIGDNVQTQIRIYVQNAKSILSVLTKVNFRVKVSIAAEVIGYEKTKNLSKGGNQNER